jgi:poly(A) polymerase Pap1
VSTTTEIPVQGVPDAYVPIIKLKILGIPIDFLMAHLVVLSILDDLTLQDDNLLCNLDDRCIWSLRGSLVTPARVILFFDMHQVPMLQTRYCVAVPCPQCHCFL